MRQTAVTPVVLGLLSLGPRSGYDIKTVVDRSTRFFWAASCGPRTRRDEAHIPRRPDDGPAGVPAGRLPAARRLLRGLARLWAQRGHRRRTGRLGAHLPVRAAGGPRRAARTALARLRPRAVDRRSGGRQHDRLPGPARADRGRVGPRLSRLGAARAAARRRPGLRLVSVSGLVPRARGLQARLRRAVAGLGRVLPRPQRPPAGHAAQRQPRELPPCHLLDRHAGDAPVARLVDPPLDPELLRARALAT